jgi:putative peptidoglycan lipid II flippase
MILRQGLRLTMFIGLPASVGLLLVGFALVRTIYERGAFGLEDSGRVATILAGYAAAVWAYSLSHVVTRCFYALGDEQAPVRVGLVVVGLNVGLNVLLVWAPLGPRGNALGVAGLAWSTAICAALQAAWLLSHLRRHNVLPVDSAVRQSWGRTALTTAVMSLVVGPIVLWIDVKALPWWGAAALLAQLVIVGGIAYLVSAWLVGAEELKWLRLQNRASNDT